MVIVMKKQKKTHKSPKELEDLFKTIAEKSPNMIFINQGGRIVYVNEKCSEIMGYRREEFYAEDFDFMALIHPDSKNLVTDNFMRHMKGEEIAPYEYKLITKNGSVLTTINSTKLINYEGDRAILGIVTDITDHKKVEEALRMRERQLADSQKVARLGSWEWDIVKDRLTWSDELYRIFGVNHHEFKPAYHAFLDLVHPDDRSGLSTAVNESLLRKKPYRVNVRMVRPDGTEWIMEAWGRVIHDDRGSPVLMHGTAQDITSRKRAEEALIRSEKKYRKLIETANDAIFLADTETGIIIDANRKAEELLGTSLENIKGMHQSDLHPREELKKYKDIFKKHVRKGDGLTTDILVINSSGQKIPVDISASITEIGGKKVIQGIFRDITERKRVEEELKKHREQLAELVKERTQEIVKANESLRQEVAVRKRVENKLLEYQKQLQSLTSQMSLIEENEKRRIAAELHDCVGQTLALSKIKLGLLNKKASSDEVKNIAREILLLIEQTIRETRTLTFELSPPILYELGLGQAIKWLIDQFHEKHGLKTVLRDDGWEKPVDNNIRFFLFQAVREVLVNIVKHAQAKEAKIIMARKDNNLRITIEDNGNGFSESSMQYNGYGLFNMRERMNHIDGHFDIQSAAGKGTRVTLIAPLMFGENIDSQELK